MLANVTILLHFLFIIFVVCGGLLVIRWPRGAFVHLPAAVWGAVVEIFGWICPLKPLEITSGNGPETVRIAAILSPNICFR